MERFVEFMRRNENDKELRSTKILKFGWMISLSSTIFVIYLNLTILIIYRVYIDAFIVGILNGKIE